VLHDAVLHHLLLGMSGAEEYIEEFVFNYGEWHRQFAAELWRNRARSGADGRYFRYAMLRRIAEVSKTVVVHNPGAAAIVRAHAPSARVVEIPHLFHPPPLPFGAETARLRSRLGLQPQTFVSGIFGYLRESKRLPVVLRAFQAIRSAGVDSALLIAGEFVSTDLARAIEPLLSRPDILRVGRLPEPDFWLHASAVDACINLRYPAAGETSGIAVRLMGIGKPVILSAGEENSRFPEGSCIKVGAGPGEHLELAQCMTWLAQSPVAAREMGKIAASHIHERHSLDTAADLYWEVLSSCRE
jgi:glycosyltransferase involved in cell wall biosynthesis